MLGQIGARRLALERGRARMGNPHRLINERRQRADELSERMSRSLHQACNRRRKELQAIEGRLLRAHPQRRIADQRAALVTLERRLSRCGSATLGERRRSLEALSSTLAALSPLKVLDRGYSLTRGPDGKVLRGRAGLVPGDALTVTLRDGDLRTRIEEIVDTKSK
jgi:exodeoxyribonuclease VII large subunit